MIQEELINKIKPGAKIRVWERIKEGDKERQSAFEGLVIARKHGSEAGATITVRAFVAGVGVEKTFPIHSPTITKVDIISSPKKIHRSKLYFTRSMSGARIRQKLGVSF